MSDERPRRLERLLARMRQLLGTATDALERVYPRGVAAWESELERALRDYHAAAYLAGSGARTPDQVRPPARVAIERDIATQLAYLRRFGVTIRENATWEKGWKTRAQSYADAIQVPYWRGRTKMLPLPAMPGEGSQCLTHCKCVWEIVTVDEAANDYDCYWRLGAAEHCQTCEQRAATWSPLEIRGGRLI